MSPRTRSAARKEEAGGAIFIGLPEWVSEQPVARSSWDAYTTNTTSIDRSTDMDWNLEACIELIEQAIHSSQFIGR